MEIHNIVRNQLKCDNSGVWILNGHCDFSYSDGAASERYLENVFRQVEDVSSRSTELEAYIKDWPSEYHLSRKRSQLLSGIDFDRKSRVLEVGCGCGAITRHLGEIFDNVVSVEGNVNRARLARQRTRDLASVSILSAPFQEVRFAQQFDLIFCIGVLEYSGHFIKAEDPYAAALEYFSNILTQDGLLVLAIENQFGLKYFLGAREDHVGTRFEGVEGYRKSGGIVRTFGKTELRVRLEKHFSDVRFLYPFPDYKMPDCVLSEEFLTSGRAGELTSQIASRDYSGFFRPQWSEASTVLELNANKALDFFANSFLVLAGKQEIQRASFGQQAIMYSPGRVPAYRTCTKIQSCGDNALQAVKSKVSPSLKDPSKLLRLNETKTQWLESHSVFTQIITSPHWSTTSISELFNIAAPWITLLRESATVVDDRLMVNKSMVDAIWTNAYTIGGKGILIDQEWEWHTNLPLNVVAIRAIYDFVCRAETMGSLPHMLRTRSGKKTIQSIACSLGVELEPRDFAEFIQLEAKLTEATAGKSLAVQILRLRWFMFDKVSLSLVCRIFKTVDIATRRILEKLFTW